MIYNASTQEGKANGFLYAGLNSVSSPGRPQTQGNPPALAS